MNEFEGVRLRKISEADLTSREWSRFRLYAVDVSVDNAE